MNNQDKIDACISAIYEGVTSEQGWFDMLKLLAETSSSKSGFLGLERTNSSQILSYLHTGFDDQAIAGYATHFVDKDLWTQQLYSRSPGSFHASHKAVAQRDFYNSEFYNDWAIRQDMHHATGVFITDVGDTSMRLTLQRDRTAGEYSQSDLHLLNRFATHLNRAVNLRNTFAATTFLKRSVTAIVDSLPFSAVILEGLDKILYFNSAAEALFARGQGFKAVQGTLKVDPAWAPLFFASVHACQNVMHREQAGPNCVHLFKSAAAAVTYEVSVTPLIVNDIQFCFGYSRNLALVIVKDQSAQVGPDPAVLSALFGLTSREALIASLLCQGHDINHIAGLTHTSVLTVRTHIKAALRKTESGNQQQLIARVLTGIAGIGGQRAQ